MNTPGQGVAGIGGTGVVVITVHWGTDTVAISIADVEFCTRIAVVARRSWHSGAGSCCAGGIRSAIRIGAVDEIIPIVIDAVVADLSAKHLDGATYGRTTDTLRLDTDLVRSWRKDRCLKDC